MEYTAEGKFGFKVGGILGRYKRGEINQLQAVEEILAIPFVKPAPNLYEALKALNEQLTGANIPFSQELFDAKVNMREALAKAEGS